MNGINHQKESIHGFIEEAIGIVSLPRVSEPALDRLIGDVQNARKAEQPDSQASKTLAVFELLLIQVANRFDDTRRRSASLLNANAVAEMLGVSRTTFYKMRAKGDFVRPVSVHGDRHMWRRADVLSWIEKRKSKRC